MEKNKTLLRALRTLFYPLASVLLKNRVAVAPVVHQLKLAFVEAARKKHGRGGNPATKNMIANLTGMSRRHVGNLLEEVNVDPCRDAISDLGESHVLAVWCSNEKFTDARGLPRHLEPGPGPGTLRALIAESTDNDEVDEVLERLLVAGNIRQLDDGKFELVTRVYRLNRDLPKIISRFISPLVHSVDKNWDLPPREGLTMRVTHSDRLESTKLPRIRRVAEEQLALLVERIDDELSRHELSTDQPMVDSNGAKISEVGVGVYYYEKESM